MLLLCGSLTACDGTDEFDPVEDQLVLDELTPVFEVGMFPPATGAPAPTPTALPELALDLPSFANNDEAQTISVANKVKTPKDQHLIGWMRWALAQPYADGAIADPTGEKCDMDQHGSVWYLAGTFGGAVERECDIPAGKKLVFPLVNQWCVFPVEYYPDDASIEEWLPEFEEYYESLRADVCGLTLRIDGVEVRQSFEELEEDFHISVVEPFGVHLHDDHWAPESFAGGDMPASGTGYYAVVNPLPPGDHVIELGGELCGEYPFSTSAIYLLHVGP